MNMRIRNVLTEYEAYFHSAPPNSAVNGKSEWKHYGDGTYRFKLSVRNLPLPDQSHVDLWLDGQWLMRLVVENKRVKIDMENDSGSGIPHIKAGQILQLKSGPNLLAEGKYRAE
jgi:hypothetical protein